MSYIQNNPFSRKSSPLNKDDRWIQKATESIKERGTEGVCTGDKFGGPTCPPGSKRYNLAKTFKKMAKDRKGGPSRESSEEKYMPIEDDMHKKGEGDTGMSRKSSSPLNDNSSGRYGKSHSEMSSKELHSHGMVSHPAKRPDSDKKDGPSRESSSPLNQDERSGEEWVEKGTGTGDRYPDPRKKKDWKKGKKGDKGDVYGGNKGDEKKSVRDYEGVSRQPYGGNKGDEKKSVRDYEGPSRKSSSPLNNTGITGLNYSKELQYMPIEDDMHRGMSRQSSSPLNDNGYNTPNPNWNQKKHDRQVKRVTRKLKKGKGVKLEKFGPEVIMESMRNTEKKEESSSPLDYGSWAHEDATRAKDLYKKGDYAHARALGIDEHDADYAKHWHKDEAEHGPSRKSRSERLRSRAMKRSERTGAEWGDYDYEDPRVQKMLSKANELDERSGKEMKMMMTKTLKQLPKKKA
jgi:hypothetical protein